jgi:hypothetical protein
MMPHRPIGTGHEFLEKVKAVLRWNPPTPPTLQDFKFELTTEAAEHNWRTFESHGNSLEQVIASDPHSVMAYGSEFKPARILTPLLESHPLWPQMKKNLENGSDPPREILNEEDRQRALTAALLRGNHRSAKKDKNGLMTLLLDDVTRGYNLPLPINKAMEIPGLLLNPMGIEHQNTINALGEIVDKKRLTHDTSFGFEGIPAHNKRLHLDQLVGCKFGWCLKRIAHLVVSLRIQNPQTPILSQKVDWSKAYRRDHYSASTALECATQCNGTLLIPLRLTFGGASNPSEFCNFSETACDLANELLHCEAWDPDILHSSVQDKIPKEPMILDDSTPFAKALPLAVDIPTETIGKADNYLDDLIMIILGDNPENIKRGNSAATLALEILGRPNAEQEPLSRSHLVSLSKLIAEGRLEEIKVILGWALDTRRLILSLSKEKFDEWSRDISHMISNKSTTGRTITTTVGRLNHVGYIIPTARHFLGRIRKFAETAFPNLEMKKRIPREVLEDLRLWIDFLEQGRRGISLNILTVRAPTSLYRADAAEHGIGGLNIITGRAWRFEIPEDLRHRATLNTLEYLGSIIGPWIDQLEGNLPEHSCIWSQTDSTTADGWMNKTNFSDATTAQFKASRKLAKILMRSKSCLVSEWIAGIYNIVSDVLSRDTDLTNNELTQLLRTRAPLQLPPNFEIKALPAEINSWLTSVLQGLPKTKQSSSQPTRSQLRRGSDGKVTSDKSTSTTSSSSRSNKATDGMSCADSQPPFERGDFSLESAVAWYKAHCKTPSAMWHRPFGITDVPIQDTTTPDTLHSFYNAP